MGGREPNSPVICVITSRRTSGGGGLGSVAVRGGAASQGGQDMSVMKQLHFLRVLFETQPSILSKAERAMVRKWEREHDRYGNEHTEDWESLPLFDAGGK